MRIITSFLAGYVLILMVSDVDCFSRSGRKACSVEVRSRTTSYLTSHIQPVYQPYLTLCQGYRLCSKYRTAYKVSQRPAYRKISQPIYTCCPRWKWGVASHRLGCNIICHPPCQNGGTCSFLNMCSCTPGWTGRFCQTDVDECAGGTHGCSQVCLNVAGSHRCGCHRGYELQMDGKSCKAFPTDAPPASSPVENSNPMLQEDVKELKTRMAALEEKFQQAMAPFLKVDLPEGTTQMDPLGLLIHSLQQLERIDSLSEQISFLEERLETCSCKNER
ncbi:epidermal growth factor-like protein 7 isoform X1 [Anolis carolinensis]|uniref:epidermal growth factor-like protein 7 isoform X1 n=1 Tax=Anolis carolinensis TaxID=28377 RepID=UPI002F2B33AE